MNKNCAALITSAGFSSRMGCNKALLRFNDKFNFIEKIIDTYTNFSCSEIIVIINPSLSEVMYNLKIRNAKIICNHSPEKDRIISIKMGLEAVNNADYCFVQSVDNPFVNQFILEKMYKNISEEAFIVPVYNNKGGHPVLLNKKIINYFCEPDLKIEKFNIALNRFPRKNIETDDKSVLFNINTPDDFEKINYCTG